MGPSTDQIREELTRRRGDAEQNIHLLTRQARRQVRLRLPLLAAAGVAAVGAVALLAVAPMLMRRRQTPPHRLRARVQGWGRAARRGYLVVGRRPDEKDRWRVWANAAVPLARAAGTAAGTAAGGRLASALALRVSRSAKSGTKSDREA